MNRDMSNQGDNVLRNALTQLAGNLSDSAFGAIVSACNFPMGLTLRMAQAVARGALQGVMQDCYDDVQKRNLSDREVMKHNLVFDIAERTYFELAAKSYDISASQAVVLDNSYLEQVSEIAEHASLEAIRQSELKKVAVLGRYYGGEFYKNGWNINFQDMHQMISMVGMLTFRQIVLIRMIAEGFNDIDRNLFIGNPSACVEMNQLLLYGIWQTRGASFGTNNSWTIQIDSVVPTDYSAQVSEALMLERLSDDDVQRTIESLGLTAEGVAQKLLTKEDYTNRTTYKVKGSALILPGGEEFDTNVDAGTF